MSEISDQNLIENLALDGQNQSQLITDHIPTWPAIDPVPATIEREFSTSDQIIKNPNEVPAETWNVDNGKAVTNEKVELGKKYVAPQNDQVSVTFTKLPDNPGTLSIEEIILSNEQMQSLNAVSVVAYDITSSMTNGTFKYELTLPKPESKKKVQIKFAEDVAGLDKANIVRSKDVKVYNNSARTVLDHFTIFVVATYADINLTTLAVSYEQGATVYANATVTNDVNYYEMDIIDPNPNIGITATSGCQTMTPSLNMSYLLASNATISNGWAVFVNEYSSLADCNSRFNPVNTQSVNFAVVVAPVIDLTPPVITILGNNPETVFQNTVYTDAGATALDDVDGDVTANIFVSNMVDTATLGTYTVTYDVVDQAGNVAIEQRTVDVVSDAIAPTIPNFSPSPGDYMTHQIVTISSSDIGSGLDKIYYTIDGSDPDKTKIEYINPITVGKDTVIKAIAYDKSGNASGIATAIFGIAPTISAETSTSASSSSVIITWLTDDPSTSRVIYDTVSHADVSTAPNYGYTNSTIETDSLAMVTSHSVVLSGLTAETTYYYRTVSHGSPEAVSGEKSFVTTAVVVSGGGNGSSGDGHHRHKKDKKKSKSSFPIITAGLFSGAAAVAGVDTQTQDDVISDNGTPQGQEIGQTEENKINNEMQNQKSPLWPWVVGTLVLVGVTTFLRRRK